MGETNQILTIHPFQFRVFDPLPLPDKDTAYILYREDGNPNKILVITSGKRVSAAEIRSGHYDRKAEISLAWRNFTLQKEIMDKSHSFLFTITVKLRYRITDCVYVFQSKQHHIEQLLRNLVLNKINSCHGHSAITYRIELENYLMNIITEGLQDMPFLVTEELSVKAELDERGSAVLQAERDAVKNKTIDDLENEREIEKIQRQKEVEEKRLKAQEDLKAKKDTLDIERAKRDKELMDTLKEGRTDYAAFKALNNGEISYLEYGEINRRNRKAAMMDGLEVLREAADIDALSDKTLQKLSLDLLGMKTEEEHQQLSDTRHAGGLPEETDDSPDIVDGEGFIS